MGGKCEYCGRGLTMRIEKGMREEVIEALFVIYHLPWVRSKKGWDYWKDVCHELERIVRTGEP